MSDSNTIKEDVDAGAASRAKKIAAEDAVTDVLEQVVALLQRSGYATTQRFHDCGELGGLAQHRKRFLLVARHMATCPDFLRDAQRRRWSREVAMLPERLAEPLSWRAGTKVFVVSMGDLFHDGVPFDFIAQVFGVMAAARGVTFQVLTKRPARMVEFFRHIFGLETTETTVFREAMEHRDVLWDARAPRMGWPKGSRPIDYAHRYPQPPDPKTLHKRLPWVWPLPNVWLGTSVEDQQRADERIPLLLAAPAAVRWLSAEPLLGHVDLGRWIGNYDCHSCGTRFWGDEIRRPGAGNDLVAVEFEDDPNEAREWIALGVREGRTVNL